MNTHAVGAFLAVYGALVLRLATRPLRAAVIAVQAVGSAGFAALQYLGLRRA